MKYLITESQLDKLIFKYLDNQDFIQTEMGNNLHFVNSENDKYVQIRYNNNDSWCYINPNLVEEISSFFSLQPSDSEKVIVRWFEKTYQMSVEHIYDPQLGLRPVLGIPSN